MQCTIWETTFDWISTEMQSEVVSHAMYYTMQCTIWETTFDWISTEIQSKVVSHAMYYMGDNF
jgi:hypothetical protein